MKRRCGKFRKLLMASAVLVVLGGGLLAVRPAAAAVPGQFNVQGALRDATGALMEGNLTLTLRIYAAQSGGTALWQETQVVAVSKGLFSALIPANPATTPFPATLFSTGQARWLGVQPSGQGELPRTPLASVPFAIHADVSSSAKALDCTGCVRVTMLDPDVLDAALLFYDNVVSGLTADTAQAAIDELAAAVAAVRASLARIATTGAFADLTGVPAGLANGDDDTLANLPCTNGKIPKRGATAWECGDDIDTKLTEAQVDTYVSNNGYALAASLATVATTGLFADLRNLPAGLANGDDDLLASLACTPGQVAKRTATGWICGDDIDTKLTEAQVDTYVSNNGFALAASLATVATSGRFTDLLNVPAGLADGDADTLGGLSCANGQVAKRTATGWLCGDDIDTKLTEAQVDAYVSNNGYASAASLATVATSGRFTDLLNVPAGLADGDQDTLGGLTCTEGQVAKRQGGIWKCGVDTDTVLTEAQVDTFVSNNGYARTADLATVATTGSFTSLTNIPAGLSDGDADTLASLTCVAGQVAKWDGTAWKCSADTFLTEAQVDSYVSNNGYALSTSLATVATTGSFTSLTNIPAGLSDGDADTLNGLVCANGQIPKRVGSAWACGDDVTGAATGGGGEGRSYYVVLMLRNATYCPSGYTVEPIGNVAGPNGWVYIHINEFGLYIGGSDGPSYGQEELYASVHTSEGMSHVCWKRYTSSSGRPHMSLQMMTGGSAASCPAGYTYIPRSVTTGNNSWGYAMSNDAGTYIGYVNSWSREAHSYDVDDAQQSYWWTTHIDTICMRVYGVDEDPATAAGVYPVFVGLQNLSYCPSGWNQAALGNIDGNDGYVYLMGNANATYFGGMYSWQHTGGHGQYVYFHNTHVYNMCWKYLVRTAIKPAFTLKLVPSGTCPAGSYAFPASHLKGWNAYAYVQAHRGFLYMGGLASWSVWDYSDGYLRQTLTSQLNNWACLQMSNVL